jgi:hypothetical protein
MEKNNIFDYLADYHYRYNLPDCIDSIKDGRGFDPKGNILEEAYHENPWYNGCLIISDGKTIVDRLFNDNIIANQNSCDFKNVENINDFQSFIKCQKNPDGAYIFDDRISSIAKVRKINNNPNPDKIPEVYDFVKEVLPYDFVFSNGIHDLEDTIENIGLKTDLSMRMVLAYNNVDSFQIKRTAYGPLGIGVVTHLGDFKNYDGKGLSKGLVERFHFEYDSSNSSKSLSDKFPIVGVYTQYEKKNGLVIPKFKSYAEIKDGRLYLLR